MSLQGSVLFEGSISDDGTLTCEATVDPGSVENFSPRGQIDIRELKEAGQVGPPFTTGASHPSFVFWAAIQNLLEESTQVGAGGGGGDNFEGLKEDQNYIMVTGATVRFPSELNKFNGAEFATTLEKKELFTAVLPSNEGGVVVSFPIFGQREVQALEDFYSQAVQAAGYPADASKPIVPLIAEIQIEGETFSGREVESNKFQYPIDICLDCTPAANWDNDPDNDEIDTFQTTSTCFLGG
jgi:hypothetical protein